MPWLRKRSGSPIPDSIRSCGELITPPARITSRSARAIDPLAAAQIFDPDGATALDQDPRRQRVDLDREIGPRQRRPQIGDGGTASPAVADRRLRAAKALLLRAVVVLGRRMTGGCPGRRRPRRAGRDSATAASSAARRRRDRCWRRPPSIPGAGNRAAHGRRTRCQAGCRPALVIAAVAADIGHRVDRGRAADHLAARAFEPAAVHRRLGLGEIHPVVLALLQHARPRRAGC